MINNNHTTTLGGDAVRLTASKIITLIITMVTTMLLSRFRTIHEYGTYSQLLLVTSLFSTLFMMGLPNSINYFLARAETQKEKQGFLSVYYTLSTVLSIFIGLLLVLAVPLLVKYFNNPSLASFYYFLALYPWASIISSSIENILVVYKRTRFLMGFRIVHSALILGSVLIIKWMNLGFADYVKLFIAVNCLLTICVYLIVYWISGGFNVRVDKSLTRAIFAFSVPLGLSAVVGTLNTELDKLMIGFLMDTKQMAIYTNAAKELPLTVVPTAITAVLLPQIVRMVKQSKSKEAVLLWGRATELSTIIIGLIVAGVFTYAKEVMTILYSAKYLPGINVFRVYTLNLILRCTYFGIILNACGKTKKIFYCSILSLCINIVLNPLLYWAFGMTGPAIATFIAIVTINCWQLRMTSRETSSSFTEVFPWRRIGVTLIINIAFAFVFGLIKMIINLEHVVGQVGESLLLGAIWAAVYVFVMRKRMVFTWNELNKGETI